MIKTLTSLTLWLWIIFSLFTWWETYAQGLWSIDDPIIYTHEQNNVIDDENIVPDDANPLREGIFKAVESDDGTEINNILNTGKITTFDDAEMGTLDIIKSFVNYALGLVSFVALIYLIYHGVMIITAAGDDSKYKKWMDWLKYAAIALVWIWLSRMIINFIFSLIWIITN